MSAPENAYETLGLSDGGPSTSESDIKKVRELFNVFHKEFHVIVCGDGILAHL